MMPSRGRPGGTAHRPWSSGRVAHRRPPGDRESRGECGRHVRRPRTRASCETRRYLELIAFRLGVNPAILSAGWRRSGLRPRRGARCLALERLGSDPRGAGHGVSPWTSRCEDETAGATRYAEVVDGAILRERPGPGWRFARRAATIPLVAARLPVGATGLPLRARPRVRAEPLRPGAGGPRSRSPRESLAPGPPTAA